MHGGFNVAKTSIELLQKEFIQNAKYCANLKWVKEVYTLQFRKKTKIN